MSNIKSGKPKERIEVAKFKGGYNREGKIWIEKAECYLCEKEKICIAADASEDEYNHVHICPECCAEVCSLDTLMKWKLKNV
jgi:hypothetical protein